jgi:hypothetical protein
MLDRADIRINGSRSWDIQIHNPGVFGRIMAQGTMGLGEAYMEGWWDCEAVDEFFAVANDRAGVQVLAKVDEFQPLNPRTGAGVCVQVTHGGRFSGVLRPF